MFGKTPRMDPLESRKRLLILESELNRVQMVGDTDALAMGVHALTRRIRSVSSLTSLAALLMAGLIAQRSTEPACTNTTEEPSRLQRILKNVGLVCSLWLAFLPKVQKPG